MSDYPSIQIEFTNAFCPRHGEPFRPGWPVGVDVAVPLLVTIFSELEVIETYAQGSAAKFQAAVAEFGPMCCAVEPKPLIAIYKRSGIGRLGICDRCREGRQGTPYRVRDGEGVKLVEHLCFECVVLGEIETPKMKPPV
jgi:hypothetical protein